MCSFQRSTSSALPITPERLVAYDGGCPFCRRSIATLLHWQARDATGLFVLDSPLARRLGAHFGEDPASFDSSWLIEAGQLHRDSDAGWRLARHFRWPWRVLVALRWVPPPLRDGTYRLIARNRHRFQPGLADADRAAIDARRIESLRVADCIALGLPESLAER